MNRIEITKRKHDPTRRITHFRAKSGKAFVRGFATDEFFNDTESFHVYLKTKFDTRAAVN